MSRIVTFTVASVLAIGALGLAACSGNTNDRTFGNGDDTDPTDPPAGSTGGFGADGGSGSGGGCVKDPANFDVPGNQCDDDGDGTVDNPPSCDSALAESGDAEDFARALGICTKASEAGYGLVSAKFTKGYGLNGAPKAQQHGILPKFGKVIKPREGGMLGVLSTGYASEYDGAVGTPFGGTTGDEGDFSFGLNGKDWWGVDPFGGTGTGAVPPGFPKAAGDCAQTDIVNDVITVKLEIKAPKNAAGIKFDFNFYSGEWPAYICSAFNDGFIAYLEAEGFNNGIADNMSFDKNSNPVSVNNGFFDRCTPNVATGCSADAVSGSSTCPGGTAELEGTGFGIEGKWCSGMTKSNNDASVNGGATGWLTSSAPVKAGETFTLEFMIWDTGDAVLDSSVLLDNFTWAAGEVETTTERPN